MIIVCYKFYLSKIFLPKYFFQFFDQKIFYLNIFVNLNIFCPKDIDRMTKLMQWIQLPEVHCILALFLHVFLLKWISECVSCYLNLYQLACGISCTTPSSVFTRSVAPHITKETNHASTVPSDWGICIHGEVAATGKISVKF